MNVRFKIIQSRAIERKHCGKLLHLSLSVTLFPNTYFLMSSLLRHLNNFLEWPLLLPLSYSEKNISATTVWLPFKNLKTSIKSPLTLRVSKLIPYITTR